MTRSSTLSEPFYSIPQSIIPNTLPTVQMMAVDILPSSLPLDASRHFSQVLFPYLISLIREYQGEGNTDAHRNALNRATVATDGALVDKHAWLKEPLEIWRGATDGMTETPSTTALNPALKDIGPPNKVLILGSGMVAGPAIDEICKRENIELIVGSFHPFHNPNEILILVASDSKLVADRLVKHHPNASSQLLDVNDREEVGHLIEASDIVIRYLLQSRHSLSLEPYSL